MRLPYGRCPVPLADADVQLLTEARTAFWKLEAYEFAYDACIRSIYGKRMILEFLGIAVAIGFLYLQYLAGHGWLHDVIGYVGTGCSLALILMVIWGHIARWQDQVEKKRDLSLVIHDLKQKYAAVTVIRPVDQDKIRKWTAASEAFHAERKHDLASLPRFYLKRGHQHVGNMHQADGVKCPVCGKVWSPELNKRRWMSRSHSGTARKLWSVSNEPENDQPRVASLGSRS